MKCTRRVAVFGVIFGVIGFECYAQSDALRIRKKTYCEFEKETADAGFFEPFNKKRLSTIQLVCDVNVRQRSWGGRFSVSTNRSILVSVQECDGKFDWLEAHGDIDFGFPPDEERLEGLSKPYWVDRDPPVSSSSGAWTWARTWEYPQGRYGRAEFFINRITGAIRYSVVKGSPEPVEQSEETIAEQETEVSGQCELETIKKRKF